MKKSVYSLVLTDAVVDAADRLAYQKGVSRSALIDEILAQSLSCMTTEMRMRDIFLSLEERMQSDQVFRMQNRGSDSMLSLFSVIKYKYKPTLRFSIELYRQNRNGLLGELKIQSRTQSVQLMTELEHFYALWIKTEQELLGPRPYTLAEGKLNRGLLLPDASWNYTEAQLGTAIGCYIQSFDKAIKLYFELLPERHSAVKHIYAILSSYVQKNQLIL